MNKKTALITGATAGIGYELARCFAKNGYDLILISRTLERLQKTKAVFEKEYKINVEIFAEDLSVPGSSLKVYEQYKNRVIDVLVNNAGYAAYGPFNENDTEVVIGTIRLNIESLTYLTKLFLPNMLACKSGKILNIASTAAFQPGPLMAVYYATKAYVISFSEALRYELKGTGVSVTTLCPGATATEFQSRANFGNSNLMKMGMMSAEAVAEIGYRGLIKNKGIVVPGFKNKIGVFAVRFAPRSLVLCMVNKFNTTEKQ